MEEKKLEHPEERQEEKQEKKKQYPVTRRGFLRLCDYSADCDFLQGCRQERSSAEGIHSLKTA